MLKTKITDISTLPLLFLLRTAICRHLSAPPGRVDLFQIGSGDGAHYTLETPGYATPPFSVYWDDQDVAVEVADLDERGSVALLDIDEAAKRLARELVEVA